MAAADSREAGTRRDKTEVGRLYQLIGSRQSYFTQKMQVFLPCGQPPVSAQER